MKIRFVSLFFLLILLAITGCVKLPGPEGIKISDAWARPSKMMTGNGAVYMNISNGGSQDDRLISAGSSVSEVVEIHQSSMVDDVMKMQRVDGIEIPANGAVSLEPGGYHVMLINLEEDFKPGDTFSLSLNFEQAGEMTVEVAVQE